MFLSNKIKKDASVAAALIPLSTRNPPKGCIERSEINPPAPQKIESLLSSTKGFLFFRIIEFTNWRIIENKSL